MPDNLAAMRRDYRNAGLEPQDLAADPVTQFRHWLADAVTAGLDEPNAMVLATVGEDGLPHQRTVLLKAVDQRGFVFFTNYGSRKGRDIAVNPAVSLLFPWHPLGRQVIVGGTAQRVGPQENAEYFHSRPWGAQIGAWASRQSTVIAGRSVLDERVAELRRRYPEGAQLPTPDFWGGFRVRAATVEFWQGRADRLHDRLRYRWDGGGWVVERLSP